MAQAKTGAPKKRSQTRKRSSAAKKTRAARPKAKSPSSSDQSSNGKSRVQAAREAVGHSTQGAGQAVGKAGQTVGKAASKAKTPLLAGGAALAGAAGGMAINAMRSRHSHPRKVLGLKAPNSKRVKIRSRDVARAAKEVGTFGQHVGELATELRHVREENSGNGGKHRSPVEVVLEGLTSRR